jgi:shikimate kinase
MSNIILIGPIGTGKSTLADIISTKLSYPRCCVDDVRWDYYQKLGYSKEKEQALRAVSFEEVYKYWKPFEAQTIIQILKDYQNHVIDFGGGHSVYEDEQLFSEVANAMLQESNVFLILPSEDKEESLRILDEREKLAINAHFIEHKSNYELAKHIVYTKGKTPLETAEEIIQLIK